jgi:hypothetical protein
MHQLSGEQIQSLLDTAANVPALQSQLQELMSQLQASNNRNHEMQQMLQAQQNQAQQNQTQQDQAQNIQNHNNTTVIKEYYRVQQPEDFTGDRKELPKFITQLVLVFRNAGIQFETDQSKINYACTYLRGTAGAWIQPHLQNTDSPILASWDAFKTALEKAFGDPDMQATAERGLNVLKQTGATSAYAAEFRRLAALTKWDTHALHFQFYKGLKESVKDEIMRDEKPPLLDDLIAKAIRIDDRQYERACEKRGQQVRPDQKVPAQNFTPASGMDVDAVTIKNKKLTPEEKQRRFDFDLCLYCGGEDHHARECKLKNKASVKSYSETKIVVPVFLNQISEPLTALVDTGGQGNFINDDLARSLNLPTRKIDPIQLGQAMNIGEGVQCTEITEPILLRVGNHRERIQLHLAPIHHQVILAVCDFASGLKPVISTGGLTPLQFEKRKENITHAT